MIFKLNTNNSLIKFKNKIKLYKIYKLKINNWNNK